MDGMATAVFFVRLTVLFRVHDTLGRRSERDAAFLPGAHTPSRGNIHSLATDSECVGGVVIGTDDGEVWRISNDAQWTALADNLPAVLSAITL